ncbi:MAG: phage tail tape measure protein [Candidatus Limiplasma sp.]|nr:phage tail tape measure protein [Candidatus Limiplasma sp.]
MSEVLRDLVVSLSLNSDNFTRNLKSIHSQIQEAESSFRLAAAGAEKFEKTTEGMQAKIGSLQKKLELQNKAVEQYGRALAAANQKLENSYARQGRLTGALEDATQRQAALKAQVAASAGQYRTYQRTLGDTASATIEAKKNLDALKGEYRDSGLEVKKLEGQLAANAKSMQNNADAVTKTGTAYNDARAAVKETQAQIQTTTAALQKARSVWTQTSATLAAFSKSCASLAKGLENIGKPLTKYLTTPIVALATAAVKASIDYESAFTSVRKTVDATEQEFDKLSEGIKTMSTQVAAGAGEIAEVTAIAGQLGIANSYLLDFTRTMIDLGNSTDIVAEEAASTLAKFANITGMDQGNFGRLGSVLVDLGNNFATTESAVMNMSLRLAAAGHQVGLTEAQILGFAAALSSVGLEAEGGGSAFSKAMIKMQVAVETGSDALTDFSKVSGMTEDAFKALWKADPGGAIQAFIVGLSKMDEEGVSAIATLEEMGLKEVRLRDTLMRATNATGLFSDAQHMANQAWNENTALSEEANKRYATTESKLKNLRNTADLFAQTLGDDLNPTIQRLIANAQELLQRFMGMDEAQRMQIIRLAAIAAAIGPVLVVSGKIIKTLGTVSSGIAKFAGAVANAGGGWKGFMTTLGKSPALWIALSIAVIAGTKALIDYATGATKAREALEGMNKTAKEWRDNAAETFYGNEGLTFFGMSREDFARTTQTTKSWLEGLLAVWSDGKAETGEIVTEWTESFQALTGATRDELRKMNEAAKGAGLGGVSSQIETDIAKLDALDAELAGLLKKRQSKLFTEKDKVRLQELIDAREAIEVKYNLSPADVDGFDTIRRKLEAEVARAQARGQSGADVSVYENAMVAAAQGMAAVNEQLDAQYDKEFALIQLMGDGAEKQQALSGLNARYNENRLTAAREYAQTLAAIVMPVWNQEDIRQTDAAIDTLFGKLREYSIAAANNDTLGMAKALEDMNKLTSSMDEGALVDYLGILTQIQALMDSGMSREEVQKLFPDIDVSGQMEEIAALTQFVKDHKGTLEGLHGIFTGAVPEEVLKITTDLDMSGAQTRWDQFASDPGAITTQAVVDRYVEADTVKQLECRVTAFVEEYTEIPEGAGKASLTPAGLLAYVAKYAEVTGGADVSALTPENITAMVAAYRELAKGADVSTLKPDEIVAYISAYLEKEGADISALTPEGITAFVLAYEEIQGKSLTKALKPTDIAAMVTRYLEAENIDVSKLTEPQITAIVDRYAEATGCDKSALGAEVTAQITAYKEQKTAGKPSYIESRVGVVGYDLAAYNAFVANNPVTLKGVVRVSEMYENPSDVLSSPGATFWEGGKEIPVNLVPANKIDASTLIAYGEDGTLHVLITPDIQGTTASVRQAAEQVMNKYVTTAIFGNETHSDWGWLNNLLGSDLITWMNGFNTELQSFERNKGSWLTLWGLLDGATLSGLDSRMDQQFKGDNLAGFSTYVAEMVKAIQNGTEISATDLQNLQDIVSFLNNLQLTGTGENIQAGVAQGMTEAGWSTDAETVASALETALNTALGIESPSTRVKPVGENVAAGVGAGMTGFDLTTDVATLATNLTTALGTAITAEAFHPAGATVAQGLGAGMTGYDHTTDAGTLTANLKAALGTALPENALSSFGAAAVTGLAKAMSSYSMSGTGSAVAANAKSAVSVNLTSFSLRSIGVNAMAGLTAGINAGRSGVVAAMKAAAQAAVSAAKTTLKIKSPSGVFRDDIGRMTKRGFGVGVTLESKAQARTISNAARYLTDAAQGGSISSYSNDNRRTYNNTSSVNLSGNTFVVRDEPDIRSLAMEIAALTKRQQRGRGLRMA